MDRFLLLNSHTHKHDLFGKLSNETKTRIIIWKEEGAVGGLIRWIFIANDLQWIYGDV